MIEAIFDSKQGSFFTNFFADCLFIYYIVICGGIHHLSVLKKAA